MSAVFLPGRTAISWPAFGMYDSGMKRVLLSWSSGKDSAWTLHVLRQQPDVELVGLLTTLNAEFQRVAMHGVRRSVLEAQAQAAGLPLWIAPLPWPCSNEVYEQRMIEMCERAVRERVDAVAFGDLFLRDVRAYREKQLAGTGLEPLFPLWDQPTDQLARTMIAGGLRAKLTCIDPKQLAPSYAGRDFDPDLLRELPASVDPCGERGEFHTCVYAGPMFSAPIGLESGPVVERDGFLYADFIQASPAPPDILSS
jgi:uncharacterized protein (TIGR00290 family)